MKILKSGPGWEFVQYPDEMKALGIMASIATLTANYGGEQVFPFVERCYTHIDRKMYGIMQARGSEEAPVSVPIGFMLWAHLSKPMEIIYSQRFRPLSPNEVRSGPNLWMVDMAMPLGYVEEAREAFWSLHPDHKHYQSTRWKEGRWHIMKYSNPAKKE